MSSWATVIEDSIMAGRPRLVTLQLRYPRFIHSEFMTHRVFSRSASSSRAIPVARLLAAITEEPVVPLEFGRNARGMQARDPLPDDVQEEARRVWLEGMRNAVATAEKLAALGVHKQHANRVTEPYSWINVVVTSTKYDNFFRLRDHGAAQPEIQKLAQDMRQSITRSRSRELREGEWHLPYVTPVERRELTLAQQLQGSVARCARVSYNLHDGKSPDIASDARLYQDLMFEKHFSPFEHQATPDPWRRGLGGNLGSGWTQYRKTLPDEIVSDA